MGGFGALFDLKDAGFSDPVLVAATDGVGTKLQIALAAGKHNTVGIDLVAMCVNDLIVQGAEPLFFLDYLATGKLDPKIAETVIGGIAEGCRRAGCALIGGETAEHPGTGTEADYDLAGFSVGAAERGQILTGENVSAGNVILGLASTGLHSNGFSLVRKLVTDNGFDYDDPAPFADGLTLGEALLEPTVIYVKSCLTALETGGVNALAHITGGGLLENIPRVLPEGLGVQLDASSWPLPPVFSWLARLGGLAPEEMARTFNCGIGMAVVVDSNHRDAVRRVFDEAGQPNFLIGSVVEIADGAAQVSISNYHEAWRP